MERIFETIIQLWRILIGRSTYDNAPSIPNATNYSKDDGFFLYVGVAGNVTAKTVGGDSWTKWLIAGFYPIKLVSITGATTTATDLLACY